MVLHHRLAELCQSCMRERDEWLKGKVERVGGELGECDVESEEETTKDRGGIRSWYW